MQYIPQSINLAHELAFCTPATEGAASLAIPGPAGPGTFWSVPQRIPDSPRLWLIRITGH